MDDQPLVSVGVCAYGRQQGLIETLNCILSQTYQNIEVLVSIDAGSPIDVELIKSTFDDSRVQFVVHSKKLYMNGNFAYVLNHTHGEYFMWAADDDLWDSQFIEACLHELLANKDAGLAIPRAILIDGQSENIGVWVSACEFADRAPLMRFKALLRDAFGRQNLPFYGLFERRVLDKLVFRNFYGSDQMLMAEVLFRKPAVLVDRDLFYFRITGDSTGRTGYLYSMGFRNTKSLAFQFPMVRYIVEYLKVPFRMSDKLSQLPGLYKAIVGHFFTNKHFQMLLKQDFNFGFIRRRSRRAAEGVVKSGHF